MALLPAYYTTTNLKKRGKNKVKKNTEHDKWLRERGLSPDQIKSKKTVDNSWKKKYVETLKVDRSTAHYDSAGLKGDASSCANRSLMSNLHKESKETREAILEKASRVMPLYNKGGLQLLSPNDDLTKIGTQSRR